MESIIPEDLLENLNTKDLLKTSKDKSKQFKFSNFDYEQTEEVNLPRLDSEMSCPDTESSKLSVKLLESVIVKDLIKKFIKDLPSEDKEEVNTLFESYLKKYSSCSNK